MTNLIDVIGSQPKDGDEKMQATLGESYDATATDRSCQYGPPEVNLSMQGTLQKAVADCIRLREDLGYEPLHPGVYASLMSTMIKLARIISASEIKHDTIVDALGYIITLERCNMADKNRKQGNAN